ncbi:MAG: response regulator [Caulobacterales bacterium]|nr:response regulator [Caulobacterales bacterium]MCA0373301.1 response regulator [Pseudomonadota bacterium]
MDSGVNILVVDDDDRIRELLKRYLKSQGLNVISAKDAAEARKLIDMIEFELIILDVMMPGEDGVSLTSAIRLERETPILLLTARGEPSDRIAGLSAGADDYLPKPFEPEELLLRIKNILKRIKPMPVSPILKFGDTNYDSNREELRRDGELIRLTESEKSLMRELSARIGATITREELARKAGVAADRSIDVQVTRLRRKLEPSSSEPQYLQTIRGLGYRLAPDL